MPLGAVADAVDLLAGVRHLLLDPHLVGVQVHQTALEAQPAGAEESLVDACGAEHVGAEVADERHRREPERPAGDEHGDAGRVGERGRDEQPVRDDDELALARAARARGSRRSCSRRARPPRLRRRARPRPRAIARLRVDLEPEPQVEPDLRLPPAERLHTAAHAGDEALSRHVRSGRCGPLPPKPKTIPQVPQPERNRASRAARAPAACALPATNRGNHGARRCARPYARTRDVSRATCPQLSKLNQIESAFVNWSRMRADSRPWTRRSALDRLRRARDRDAVVGLRQLGHALPRLPLARRRARRSSERIADAALVHRLTGCCPRVALHIPWDARRRLRRAAPLRRGAGHPDRRDQPEPLRRRRLPARQPLPPRPGRPRRRRSSTAVECIEIAERGRLERRSASGSPTAPTTPARTTCAAATRG